MAQTKQKQKRKQKQKQNCKSRKTQKHQTGGTVDHKSLRELTGIPYLAKEYAGRKISDSYPGMPETPPAFLNDCVIL